MKKMFKVLSAVEKDGKTLFWMRLGSAFVNRDNSINVYLEACPRSMQFQIREMDERDFRKRDGGAADDAANVTLPGELPLQMSTTHHQGAAAGTDVPF